MVYFSAVPSDMSEREQSNTRSYQVVPRYSRMHITYKTKPLSTFSSNINSIHQITLVRHHPPSPSPFPALHSPHLMHYSLLILPLPIFPLPTARLIPIPHLNPLILHHARLPTTPTRVRHPDRPLLEPILRTIPRIGTGLDKATTGDTSWDLAGRLVVTIAVLTPGLFAHVECCKEG
jgi:hypothetical protein